MFLVSLFFAGTRECAPISQTIQLNNARCAWMLKTPRRPDVDVQIDICRDAHTCFTTDGGLFLVSPTYAEFSLKSSWYTLFVHADGCSSWDCMAAIIKKCAAQLDGLECRPPAEPASSAANTALRGSTPSAADAGDRPPATSRSFF